MMHHIHRTSLLCLMLLCMCLFPGKIIAAAEMPDGLFAEPISFILSAQFESLAPFEETRLAQWNALIRHISLEVDADDTLAMTTVLVDEDKAFRLIRVSSQSVDSLTVDTLPQVEFVSDPETIDAFMGPGILSGFDRTLEAVTRSRLAVQLCDKVFSSFHEKMTEKKEKQIVKGYGNTTRRLTLSEDVLSIWGEIGRQLLSENGSFSGKQTLYYLADDDDVFYKCGYTGNVETGGKNWNVTASMKTDHEDRYEIVCTATVRNEKNAVTDKVEWTFSGKHADDVWSGDTALVLRHGKEQTVFQCSAEITSQGNALRGKITYREGSKATGSDGMTVILMPEMTLAGDTEEGSTHFEGTVSVHAQKEKTDILAMTVSVSGKTGTAEFSLVAPQETQIDIASLTPEDSLAWRERITRTCASALLREMVYIDTRDLAWIRDGLDEAFWEELIRKSGPLLREDEDR
ncbi:MAG: hypothetical protein IJ229_11555 [Clostridia bacterium]|nr:hypothetical protein [Clostridia bacterium]